MAAIPRSTSMTSLRSLPKTSLPKSQSVPNLAAARKAKEGQKTDQPGSELRIDVEAPYTGGDFYQDSPRSPENQSRYQTRDWRPGFMEGQPENPYDFKGVASVMQQCSSTYHFWEPLNEYLNEGLKAKDEGGEDDCCTQVYANGAEVTSGLIFNVSQPFLGAGLTGAGPEHRPKGVFGKERYNCCVEDSMPNGLFLEFVERPTRYLGVTAGSLGAGLSWMVGKGLDSIQHKGKSDWAERAVPATYNTIYSLITVPVAVTTNAVNLTVKWVFDLGVTLPLTLTGGVASPLCLAAGLGAEGDD